LKVEPPSPHSPLDVEATLEDQHLLERCRAGDDASWRALFDAHFPFVYRTVRRLGVLGPEADDLTQEVFLVAFQRLSQFREGKLTTWLYRIAANLVSDRHRKRTVRDALFGLFGAVEETRVHERTPHHDYEARESEAQVAQIIQRMAAKKREVFVLYELEQLSGEEIAERVGVPVGTVWTRLHHARLEFDRIAKKRGLA
jgi:RNA polymerase sigma-70 factor (ECF subfamily)